MVTNFRIIWKSRGKVRNLQRRKYCLECSPFGSHNTVRLHEEDEILEECAQCGDELNQGSKYCSNKCKNKHYYRNNKEKWHEKYQNNKEKRAEESRQRRKRKKRKAIVYKGGSCVVCGYSECDAALEFHHIDPEEKEFGICRGIDKSWSTLQEELNKCVLMCGNCHSEFHDEMIDLNNFLCNTPSPSQGEEYLKSAGYDV